MFSADAINLTKQKVSLPNLVAAAVFVAKRRRLDGELSIVLGGDKRLRTLNYDFRGKDKATDILTFPAPAGASGALGEIFINLQDCRRPLKYREIFPDRRPFAYLLFFLLIHGLLHLAGEEDETEAGRLRMVAAGKKMMEELIKNDIIKAN